MTKKMESLKWSIILVSMNFTIAALTMEPGEFHHFTDATQDKHWDHCQFLNEKLSKTKIILLDEKYYFLKVLSQCLQGENIFNLKQLQFDIRCC